MCGSNRRCASREALASCPGRKDDSFDGECEFTYCRRIQHPPAYQPQGQAMVQTGLEPRRSAFCSGQFCNSGFPPFFQLVFSATRCMKMHPTAAAADANIAPIVVPVAAQLNPCTQTCLGSNLIQEHNICVDVTRMFFSMPNLVQS